MPKHLLLGEAMHSSTELMALIMVGFGYLKAVNPKHFATFFGQRSSGSRWGRHNLPDSPLWYSKAMYDEVSHNDLPAGTAISACRYLRTFSLFLLRDAMERALPLTELSPELKGMVQLVDGVHGKELVLPEGVEVPERHAREAWVILGPAGDKDPELVPWTAFPGRILAPLPREVTKLEEVDFKVMPYAVKLL